MFPRELRNRNRNWRLKRLEAATSDTERSVETTSENRFISHFYINSRIYIISISKFYFLQDMYLILVFLYRDYMEFLEDIEEDPVARKNINVYRGVFLGNSKFIGLKLIFIWTLISRNTLNHFSS